MWETEDSGLKVQVWEKHDRREMRFGNHIMQSVFSRINVNHLVLPYSRFMLLGLIFCPEPKSALHLGLGGGSIPRWLHIRFPGLQQTVIEQNASVIEAAQRYFEFPVDKRISVIQDDAEKIKSPSGPQIGNDRGWYDPCAECSSWLERETQVKNICVP